ncbi:hypothetical protein PTSG_04953 [Salpingoeca rosetta]|uniref:Uncharacterized protein n=1 Tax=Salpingoeca rosetta (strain ATCC 50818 / BSB-021) TaxID=946362 RepID=F2U934_SALR5|nr:uncharacterized protein PTSG_04953 [Salpingoeca rosetta]EGD73237.1 hypothetical protein PTSG_04953 [Salpingoeca rosetta]|eukprot:XP_004994268.1 hypothetical protein PTSG_04953 [Salpingoeca rosetta]
MRCGLRRLVLVAVVVSSLAPLLLVLLHGSQQQHGQQEVVDAGKGESGHHTQSLDRRQQQQECLLQTHIVKASEPLRATGWWQGHATWTQPVSQGQQCWQSLRTGGSAEGIRAIYQYLGIKAALSPTMEFSQDPLMTLKFSAKATGEGGGEQGADRGPQALIVVSPHSDGYTQEDWSACLAALYADDSSQAHSHAPGPWPSTIKCRLTSLSPPSEDVAGTPDSALVSEVHLGRSELGLSARAGSTVILDVIVGLACVRCTHTVQFDAIELAVVDGKTGAALAAAPMCPRTPTHMPQHAREGSAPTTLQTMHLTGPPFKHPLSIVTQVSLDRLSLLRYLPSTWSGPVSMAVHHSDDSDGGDGGRESAAAWVPAFVLKHLRKLAPTQPWAATLTLGRTGEPYPINALRNAAIEGAATDFVFIMDADFVPTSNLKDQFALAAGFVDGNGDSVARTAFVVPAFEMLQGDRASIGVGDLPKTMEQLVAAMEAGTVRPFRESVSPLSHAATDYSYWRHAYTPYTVDYQVDLYEPYVIVQKTNHLPLFDPNFTGYGMNKISHSLELHAAGYQFVVVPRAWIMHLPHPESQHAHRFLHDVVRQAEIRVQRFQFVRHLQSKFALDCDGSDKTKSS